VINFECGIQQEEAYEVSTNLVSGFLDSLIQRWRL
jgi:hypothetical protein